jgi:hypothetical protein
MSEHLYVGDYVTYKDMSTGKVYKVEGSNGMYTNMVDVETDNMSTSVSNESLRKLTFMEIQLFLLQKVLNRTLASEIVTRFQEKTYGRTR